MVGSMPISRPEGRARVTFGMDEVPGSGNELAMLQLFEEQTTTTTTITDKRTIDYTAKSARKDRFLHLVYGLPQALVSQSKELADLTSLSASKCVIAHCVEAAFLP